MDAFTSPQISQLLDRHGAALVLYARQWCDAPDDVVQEALIALWRLPQPPENPVGWLYRAVRNGAIDCSRAERRRTTREAAAARSRPQAWFLPASESGLEGAEVAAALATLPIEQREIIVARLWSGLTFAQIAELTDSSTSTAHRRYVEGLTILRERLLASCPQQNIERP